MEIVLLLVWLLKKVVGLLFDFLIRSVVFGLVLSSDVVFSSWVELLCIWRKLVRSELLLIVSVLLLKSLIWLDVLFMLRFFIRVLLLKVDSVVLLLIENMLVLLFRIVSVCMFFCVFWLVVWKLLVLV